jgi:hypothetical protein
MMDRLKLNPVRLYAVAVAVMAVVAHYLPSLPTALYLGLVAAVLGVGGEVVRLKVTPNATAKKDVAKAYTRGVLDAPLLRRRG